MVKNKTLPILLKNQKILLIGGGNVALQKAKVLHENEIDFTVIAETFKDEMIPYAPKIIQKPFKLKDIGEFYIIIDATGNPKVAKRLLEYKKKHTILLNIVDVLEFCDFYFMALTKNRPLQIAVSSNGASPTAAKFFRDECEKLIPEDIAAYLEAKQKEREAGIIDIEKTRTELLAKRSKVYLVGCGLGDPDLLTIRAYRVILSVDIVLYDHLISEEIMALLPEKTQRVSVGKQKGFHTPPQEEINALIIHYASQGKSVARLKSGDPFVFGRGAEEMLDITAAGLECEVVPGISSAISGCSMAGIPITARGYASGFTVVSAHLKDYSINLDWVPLLARENHTVVVLMGLSRTKEIVQECSRLHIQKEKLCAIISNASRPNQKVITCELGELDQCADQIERPAILVFGDVVEFAAMFNQDHLKS